MLKTLEADQVMSLAMRLPLQLYSHFCSLGCPIVCDMSVSKNVKTWILSQLAVSRIFVAECKLRICHLVVFAYQLCCGNHLVCRLLQSASFTAGIP